MNPSGQTRQTIVLAGASGDLGERIAKALCGRGADVRALVRTSSAAETCNTLASLGATPIPVNFDDAAALTAACEGADCLVSALNGLAPAILGAQGRLLDAALAARVPRFIPSDYSLDFTKTEPGGNRNLDLRRAFMQRIDQTPIRATSVLNGAFADLLTGEAPIILNGRKKVLYWGEADQPLDFTTKDDVARYTARVALDEGAPRILRIAGDVVSPRALAALVTDVQGRRFGLLRAGGIGRLSLIIKVVRALTPQSEAPFPIWQGMQYMRDMSSGRGKLEPLDNDRYGPMTWTTARDVLRQAA